MLVGVFMIVAVGFDIAEAQRAPILRGVNAVQVNPTVVANPEKVQADFAPVSLQDALRSALRNANFDTPESAQIRAHLVLDEFTSGSTAKRVLVGLGAGRSTVDGRLVFQGEDGKELSNVRTSSSRQPRLEFRIKAPTGNVPRQSTVSTNA